MVFLVSPSILSLPSSSCLHIPVLAHPPLSLLFACLLSCPWGFIFSFAFPDLPLFCLSLPRPFRHLFLGGVGEVHRGSVGSVASYCRTSSAGSLSGPPTPTTGGPPNAPGAGPNTPLVIPQPVKPQSRVNKTYQCKMCDQVSIWCVWVDLCTVFDDVRVWDRIKIIQIMDAKLHLNSSLLLKKHFVVQLRSV